MFCTSASIRKVLERDLADSLQRLRSARAKGDENQATAIESRMDWMLDRLAKLLAENKEREEDLT